MFSKRGRIWEIGHMTRSRLQVCPSLTPILCINSLTRFHTLYFQKSLESIISIYILCITPRSLSVWPAQKQTIGSNEGPLTNNKYIYTHPVYMPHPKVSKSCNRWLFHVVLHSTLDSIQYLASLVSTLAWMSGLPPSPTQNHRPRCLISSF